MSEEEEEIEKYANHRYYPLLEFVQRWEDFHDETISDWINYYDKDDAFPHITQNFKRKFKKLTKPLISTLKKPILQLLSGERTINGYLGLTGGSRLIGLYYRSFTIIEFLLGKVGAERVYPTNKKLFDFLMKDRNFSTEININTGPLQNPRELAKYAERIYRLYITDFELVNELIQTTVDLTPAEEITQQSKDLLASLLVGEKDTHPDALGGPYALLGDILFGENLDASQRKHVKELKHLLKFDEIRRDEQSNFAFVKKLFRAIYYHTDPAISHCILQLLRGKPQEIVWDNQTLLKDLTYVVNKLWHCYYISYSNLYRSTLQYAGNLDHNRLGGLYRRRYS